MLAGEGAIASPSPPPFAEVTLGCPHTHATSPLAKRKKGNQREKRASSPPITNSKVGKCARTVADALSRYACVRGLAWGDFAPTSMSLFFSLFGG